MTDDLIALYFVLHGLLSKISIESNTLIVFYMSLHAHVPRVGDIRGTKLIEVSQGTSLSLNSSIHHWFSGFP